MPSSWLAILVLAAGAAGAAALVFVGYFLAGHLLRQRPAAGERERDPSVVVIASASSVAEPLAQELAALLHQARQTRQVDERELEALLDAVDADPAMRGAVLQALYEQQIEIRPTERQPVPQA